MDFTHRSRHCINPYMVYSDLPVHFFALWCVRCRDNDHLFHSRNFPETPRIRKCLNGNYTMNLPSRFLKSPNWRNSSGWGNEFSGFYWNSSGSGRIRLIKNPFIPLSFHWKKRLYSPNIVKKSLHAFSQCGFLLDFQADMDWKPGFLLWKNRFRLCMSHRSHDITGTRTLLHYFHRPPH